MLLGQVCIPNKVYSGQKLIRLVNTKMVASESNTIPTVPLITPVKYKTATITPTDVLLNRSMLPMFFCHVELLLSL